jgi:predicted deacylase
MLRDNFVFKVFPMVNPDGVIHGNYRCSLSGRDLNRRWKESCKELFPEVYYIRNHIFDIAKKRSVKMILDLHGHTRKKKVFVYGCSDRMEPHRCRLFPYLVSKFTPYF